MVPGLFANLVRDSSGCGYARIMLCSDMPYLSLVMGARAMQLSDRIGRRMKLHDLHVLMAVVQAGSMNKAAVHLEHRAVRHFQIHRGIGTHHRRTSARPQPRRASSRPSTVAPCSMVESAVFDDLRQAVKNIEFLADPTAGEVRIGCSAVAGRELRFRRRRSALSALSAHCVSYRDWTCGDTAPGTERT